jgi:hypothetical protein
MMNKKGKSSSASRRSVGTEQSRSVRSEEDIFLQPWFVPKDVYLQIRRLLPNAQLSKMRYYFEDYGCLKCSKQDTIYGSNGLCERCSVLIRGRLQRCLQRRLRAVGVTETQSVSPTLLGGGMETARTLLQSVRPKHSRVEPVVRRRSPRNLIG